MYTYTLQSAMGRSGLGGEAKVDIGVGAERESTLTRMGSECGNKSGGSWVQGWAMIGHQAQMVVGMRLDDGKLELCELRKKARG